MTKRFISLAILLIFFMPVKSYPFANDILIINSYSSNYPWTKHQLEGFFEKMQAIDMLSDFEIHMENLDTKKFDLTEEYMQHLFELFYFKYKQLDNYPSVIYVTDDNAMIFLNKKLRNIFPDTPVIFTGINNLKLNETLPAEKYSGCFEIKNIEKNIELAEKLFGRNKEIVFIGDNSETADFINSQIKSIMDTQFDDINYQIIQLDAEKNIENVLEKMDNTDKKIFILTTIGAVKRDTSSVTPIPLVIKQIRKSAGNAPIMSMEDVYVIEGVLGGYVTSGKLAGSHAAEMLETLINSPDMFKSYVSYPKETSEYVFNYKELQRFNIRIADLPSDAKIINRPFSVYEEYKEIIWLTIATILLMFTAIVLLALKIIADKRLKSAENKLAEMLKIANHIIYHFDVTKQRYEYISDYASTITGVKKDFFTTPNPFLHETFMHKEDYEKGLQTINEASERGEKSIELTYRLRTKNGEYRWFKDLANLIYDNKNNLVAIAGTAYDIDKEKRIDDALKLLITSTIRVHGYNYFRQTVLDIASILQCSFVFISEIQNNSDARTLAFCENGQLKENFTFSLSDLPCLKTIENECICLQDAREKFPENKLFNNLGIDSFMIFKMFDEKGKNIGLLAALNKQAMKSQEIYINILSMITKRTSLELERIEHINKLSDERERLNVIIKSIGDAVVVTDLKGEIQLVNRTFEHYYGQNAQQIIGKDIRDLLFFYDENTSEPIKNPVDEILENGLTVSQEVSALMQTDKGDRFFIEDSVSPLRDFESKIIGAVLVFRDATAKKQMEKERIKQTRLESIGILAGGIAHDFNNMLTALSNNIELIKLKDKDKKFSECLSKIDQVLENAQNLAHQLLTFSKGGEPQIKKINLETFVNNTLTFLLRGSSVTYTIKSDENLWTALIDPGQFSQVIQNIIINARQAIEPNEGKIEVNLSNYEVDESKIYKPGKYLKIAITDNGPGINKKNLEKIFDPYFTTKESGSGLGLAITHSIIKKHHGYISVESEKNVGTTFHIIIPATLQKPDEFDVDKINQVNGKNKKILIMDDDEMVRESLKNVLSHYGYDIYTVSNGEEFIERYQSLISTGIRPVICFMDITIPGGMGARMTITKIREIDPDVKAVVMSGYSESDEMINPEKYGFLDILKKPYKINDLLYLLDKYT